MKEALEANAGVARYQARRKALMEAAGEGLLIVPSAPPVSRNADAEYAYRQRSDLLYLSGLEEAHAVLVLCPGGLVGEAKEGAAHAPQVAMFLRERDPVRERWDGPMLGVVRAPEALGVDLAFPITALEEKLACWMPACRTVWMGPDHGPGGEPAETERLVRSAWQRVRSAARGGRQAPSRCADVTNLMAELRVRKDDHEIACMQRAASITCEAHQLAFQKAAPGVFEYEVEAELLHTFRRHGGAGPAYENIVASGANATVLHYRANRRCMQEHDLLLIDAGCEWGGYAADLTRTVPVSKRFRPPQQALYEIVLDAQKRAIAMLRPGVTMDEVHDAATEVIVEGLCGLGLLTGSAAEARENGSYRRYFMHRCSHFLGLDVHDVGATHIEGKARPLMPGMVITVEPGIYVAPPEAPGAFGETVTSAASSTDVALRSVEEAYLGIGIRIEDDVLITEQGHEVLTKDAPKEVDDLLAWCR